MQSIRRKRRWRDIQETANQSLRLEKVHQAKARATEELAGLKEQAELLADVSQDHVHHPGIGKGTSLQLAGLCTMAALLLALDVPIQFLLNRVALPEVELWVLALIAPAIALGLAALVHGATLAFFYDRDRPARSIRICRLMAGLSFVVTAAGTTVFLFARQASADVASHIVTLTSISLWTVAEALPLSAGFFLAWAHILGQPSLARRHRGQVQRHIGMLSQFVARLDQEESALSASVNGTGRSASRMTAAAVLVLFAALGSFAPALHAAQTPNRICGLFMDRSLSVQGEHRARTVKLVSESLPEALETLGCTELVVGTFSNEGAWAPRRWLLVPQRPPERDCELSKADVSEGTTGLLANLQGFRTHFRTQAIESCKSKQAERMEAFDAKRQAFLATARPIIEQPQLTHETETNILGVIDSLLETGVQLIMIATDGLETTERTILPLRIPDGSRVVLILLPARDAYGGANATREAAKAWEKAGATVLPYTALIAPSAWRRLLAE